MSDTDWVKNGNRWEITHVHTDGAFTVARVGAARHRVRLPAAYVAEHVQLGYAATVHSAQGMTVDTSHTVLAGAETRQMLYVALTRGRMENHVYLTTPTETEPDALSHADAPSTALEARCAILDRDGAQESATTARRVAADPAGRLQEAVLRYKDALTVTAGTSVRDHTHGGIGPLPWLPAVPERLASDPEWATYLRERTALIKDLAEKVALNDATGADPHPWADGLSGGIRAEVAVWRAAHAIADTDPRPTGPLPDDDHAAGYQYDIDRRIRRSLDRAPTSSVDWNSQLPPEVLRSPGILRTRLTELHTSGADVPGLIAHAIAEPRPLPVENPGDAPWWRVVGAHATTPRVTTPPPNQAGQSAPAPRPALRPELYPSMSPTRDRPRGPAH